MAAMPMIQATLPQTASLPAPAPEAALVQLARAALGLVQSAGQPVPALVVGTMTGGLTQLQIGEMVLAVRLSAPLVAGTAVKLTISTDSKGQAGLQVTPVVTGAAASSAQLGTPALLTLPPGAQSVVATPQMAAPAPIAATIASPMPQSAASAPVSAGIPTIAPAATTTMAGAPTAAAPAGSQPATLGLQEMAPSAVRPPIPAAATMAGATTSSGPSSPTINPAALAVAPSQEGAKAIAAAPIATGPARAAPAVAEADGPAPIPNLATPGMQAGADKSGARPALAAPSTPNASGSSGALPTASGPVAPQQRPTQVVSQPTMVAAASSNIAATPAAVANPSPAPVQTTPSQGAVASGQSILPSTPHAGGAMAIPYRAAPPGPPQAAAPALPLAQILADPAQAAARQNSIVPLLARLAALGPQLSALPVPAAQAALRLLAMRLEVGGLDGKALQGAVATAGVLARPGAGAAPAAPTLKSALLQLRGGLAGVPGAEIEAVTAIAGRPHPPVKGDEARAVRAELPLPMEGEEPARGLLGQTDAALSRLKLLQHASQPPEARPGAAAQQELRVEVPLLIGAQTALLQLVVDRDARRRDRPGERGWRMRFAFASQQTGEVGAEVALFGPSVSVALWADTPEMEAAMAEGLEGLRAALLAQGLEAGSIRVRRRAAAPSQQPGMLMDSAR